MPQCTDRTVLRFVELQLRASETMNFLSLVALRPRGPILSVLPERMQRARKGGNQYIRSKGDPWFPPLHSPMETPSGFFASVRAGSSSLLRSQLEGDPFIRVFWVNYAAFGRLSKLSRLTKQIIYFVRDAGALSAATRRLELGGFCVLVTGGGKLHGVKQGDIVPHDGKVARRSRKGEPKRADF